MSRKKNKNIEEDFVYCDTRGCKYNQCLRKIINAPFDELVLVTRYEVNKKGTCKGFLEEY